MKGMKRWRWIIINAFTVLSLLLCVATAGLWLWSFSAISGLDRYITYRGQQCRLYLICGKVGIDNSPHVSDIVQMTLDYNWLAKAQIEAAAHTALMRTQGDTVKLDAAIKDEAKIAAEEVTARTYLAGLAASGSSLWSYSSSMAIPVGAILCGVLPLIALVRRGTAVKSSSRGLCVQCGYDLRATPDRCPECGTIPAKVKP